MSAAIACAGQASLTASASTPEIANRLEHQLRAHFENSLRAQAPEADEDKGAQGGRGMAA
jgi:hypothetical protein